MMPVLPAFAAFVAGLSRSRLSLQFEVMALRHQLGACRQGRKRPNLSPADRLFWAWLSRSWRGWRDALVPVGPETVISWQRKRFRDYWTRLIPGGKPGRPAGQQVLEAFPWEAAPKYLLRDRGRIYEGAFRKRVLGIGFEEILITPGSPWQNPFVERLIGTIRRECLDHVIVINERHLKRSAATRTLNRSRGSSHLLGT